jgi:rhomboid protease GluP
MSFWDKVLRLLGTNRVRAAWRWRQMKESWNKPGASGGGGVRAGGLIPDEFPLVTVVLIGVSLVFYFLTVKMTNDFTGESGSSPGTRALVVYGAAFTPLVLEGGEWWRLVSSIFLHGGLMHILMNGLSLWTVGNAVEEHFGRARALVVFVVSGAAGMLLAVLSDPMMLVVGASGGLFGLIGCMVAHAMRDRNSRAAREMKARFVPWLLFGAIISFMPGVSLMAHLGGLIAGGALGFFLGEQSLARRRRFVWEALAMAAVAVVATAFVLASRSPFIQG